MLTGVVAGGPSRAACQNDRESTQGGGHRGRTVRRRRPRWRPGWVRRRALRRVAGLSHRASSRRQRVGGHVPAPRLHPGQGAAPDGRGAAHRAAAPRSSASTPASPRSTSRASQARKQQVIDRLTKGLESLLKGRKVTVVPGTGSIVDAGARHIRVVGRHRAHRQRADPRHRLGARARSPASTSTGSGSSPPTTCSRSTQVPARVAIIGGGRDRLRVRVAARRRRQRGHARSRRCPRSCPGVDTDAADVVVRAFKKRGIKVAHRRRASRASKATRELAVALRRRRRRPSRVVVDQVVVSVGRAPALGGHRARGLGRRGRRPRLRRRSTARCARPCPGVYAVGDVVATPAARARRLRRGDRRDQDDPRRGRRSRSTTTRCPGASTATPRSRSAGSPRSRRSERGHDVVTSVHRFVGNSRALIIGEPDGLVKIVAERDGPILGVHIVGPVGHRAARRGLPRRQLGGHAPRTSARSIHPHPTLSELFGESALAAHRPQPARLTGNREEDIRGHHDAAAR